MADSQGGGGGGNTSGSTSLMRDYKKGNWTVDETMILIEAKKMDDERRMKRSSGNDSEGSGIRINKPAELRWKWVEDYCWRKGCLRSQNQCNDKWDNLMRDYKKVRDYERKLQPSDHDHDHHQSYWKIEKNERKEKNLPTNMLPQIYEALVEVVEKKNSASGASASSHQRVLERSTTPSGVVGYNMVERATSISSAHGTISTATATTSVIHHQHQHQQQQQQQVSLMASQTPVILQHHISAPSPIAALPLPASVAVPSAPSPIQAQSARPYSQPILPTMCDSSDSDTSEHSDSPAKRRRKSAPDIHHHHHQHHQEQIQGTTSASQRNINTTTLSSSPSPPSTTHELASAISKSASVIAEALQASEEREERRHRDLLSLHERRLKIEESKNEINRQGISGLVEAINNLANSIQALASEKHGQPASKPPS